MNFQDLFKKTKKEYVSINLETPNVPKGLMRKCKKCKAVVLAEDVKEAGYTCPKCGGYFRMHAYRRIEAVGDAGSFIPWFEGMTTSNPLEYPEYPEKVKALQEKSGLDEAVITGEVKIDGTRTAIAVMDGRFLMASMGEVVGEKITLTVEKATKENLPVIIFACSGGARMQEGIMSLMQMAKTSAALKRHSDSGNLYISVLTDPTTGGVTASFAMLGDIILAEPKALIGFAGPRVIEQTIGQKLPKGFQRSEFLLEHGFVDAIVERKDMKDTLSRIVKLHYDGKKMSGMVSGMGVIVDSDVALGATVDVKSDMVVGVDSGANTELKSNMTPYADVNIGENADTLSDLNPGINAYTISGTKSSVNPDSNTVSNSDTVSKTLSAWDRVLISRLNDRPVGEDYISELFTDFIDFHGDRYFKDDKAIVGGIARFNGIPVTVIAQAKGRNTKDNIERNFGMPSPDGYRKALRLMKQAEKFGRPIICFVDTPGAFCGLEAEERGQGEAIARNLFEMSALKVPVLSVVIGEGGSGGALAMAVSDEVWMLENSVYSILSPEGYASILWKDSKRATEAAEVMKMTASDLKEMGIVEKVFTEPESYTIKNLSVVTDEMSVEISRFLSEAGRMSGEEIADRRYERFRRFG